MEDNKYAVHSPDGSVACYINKMLVRRKNISDETFARIIMLHEQKLAIYHGLEVNVIKPSKEIAEHLEDIEFKLQDAWGFTRDVNWHKFWETPQCLCASLDNLERWPEGGYWVSASCPLHGGST